MKRHLIWLLLGILALWIEAFFGFYVHLGPWKISWSLITLLVLVLRNQSAFLVFYALFLGGVRDSFSHGVLGVYGTSFFVAALCAWIVSSWYSGGGWTTFVLIAVLSLVETIVSSLLFKMLWPDWNLIPLVLDPILPTLLLQALVSPLVAFMIDRVEKRARFRHLENTFS